MARRILPRLGVVLLAGLAALDCGGQFGAGPASGGAAGANPGTGGTSTGGSSTGGGPASGGTGGGVPIDVRACSVNSECILRAASCCGSCGSPTRADVIALNQAALDAYSNSVCDPAQQCPDCPAPAPDPTLIATCQQGQCEVVDLTTSPITACSGDTACVIRTNACCECGGPMDQGSIIAINHDSGASYAALVCNPDATCADCLPVYPTSVQAVCNSGHCLAKWN
jgi:hypothetical protein